MNAMRLGADMGRWTNWQLPWRRHSIARTLLALLGVVGGLVLAVQVGARLLSQPFNGEVGPLWIADQVLLGILAACWIGVGLNVWLRKPSQSRAWFALVLCVWSIILVSDVIETPETWVFVVPCQALYLSLALGIWAVREWARGFAVFVGFAMIVYGVAGVGRGLIAQGVNGIELLASIDLAVRFPVVLVLFGLNEDTRAHFAALRSARAAVAG